MACSASFAWNRGSLVFFQGHKGRADLRTWLTSSVRSMRTGHMKAPEVTGQQEHVETATYPMPIGSLMFFELRCRAVCSFNRIESYHESRRNPKLCCLPIKSRCLLLKSLTISIFLAVNPNSLMLKPPHLTVRPLWIVAIPSRRGVVFGVVEVGRASGWRRSGGLLDLSLW